MKILFLSQFFSPEPFFKALPFALGLARRGHEIEVLTGFPNYPGGRLYAGYRIRPWQRETIEGIRVIRVPLYPSHDRSSFRRAANYGSFALSSSLLGPFLTRKPDVAYVYHPPATNGLPACVLGLLKRSPFVYDIQDLWPDAIASSAMLSNPLVLGAIRKWCSFVYRQAGHLTVLSPGFLGALVARGVPEDKISVIYNWCDEESIHPETRDENLRRRLGLTGRFCVMFAGTMGIAQSLDVVLEAAALCSSVDSSIQFVLVGGGVDRPRLEAKAIGLHNVVFLPPQRMQDMSPILALADVLLVHLKNDPLFRITIPSKTQSSMAAAKPVLMAVSGDAAYIVQRAQAGLTVPPENAPEIARAVLQMSQMDSARLSEMGIRGRSFYLREMSMETGIDRYEQLFETVCRTPVPRGGVASG